MQTEISTEQQNSMVIPGVPDSISRARIAELVQSLGLDVRELVSFELKVHAIHAVVYALNEDGHRYFVDDDNVAKHHITIPITDAQE